MRRLVGHTGPVRCLAYSPDGTVLASGGDDRAVALWTLATTQRTALLRGHAASVRALAFFPEDGDFVSAGWDGRVLRRKVGHSAAWPFPAFRQSTTEQHGGVWSFALAPDGQAAVAGLGDGFAVQVLGDRRRPHPRRAHEWPVAAVAFGPDGRTFVTGSHDRTVRVWDAAWGRRLFTLSGHPDWVCAVALAPDGQTLAVGCDDGSVVLWAPADRTEVGRLAAHRGRTSSVIFTPDGRSVLSAGWDGTVRLWDAATWRERSAHDWGIGRVHCAAIAPDGLTAAAGGHDGSIVLWDLD